MCGIAGYVDFSGRPIDRRVLACMVHALRRRGPDAEGVLTSGPCGLAHTRLSILDVVASRQPMSSAHMSIVYNGELYNYRILADSLRRDGVAFRTSGDTEVVLHAVEREWHEAIHRFDGMFALAAWDLHRRRLLLARDAIGEKPLYYATPRYNLLVFASEIKALFCHPEVAVELDEDGLRQVLRFRSVYGEGTQYRGVWRVPPGGWLEFSEQRTQSGQHFDLAVEVRRAHSEFRGVADSDVVATGQSLLRQSVQERLIADVPVGAFLSGGLDSSLITAMVREIRGPEAELATFSVGFEDDPSTELPFAAQVAKWARTQHTEVRVGPAEYAARLAELSGCRDGPVSEPADVAIACMSRVARGQVKVVLSGEGADEVFAGYPKYRWAGRHLILGAAARALGPRICSRLASALGLDVRRVEVLIRAMSQRTEHERHAQWFSYGDRDWLASLFPALQWSPAEWAKTVEPHARASSTVRTASALTRMLASDCLTWLPNNLLERGDRMTMCEGLELRPPFLDRELVAFGLALRDGLRIHRGAGKAIVRKWASHRIPSEILRRKKWGFRVPLARWFAGPLRDLLDSYVGAQGGLCDAMGGLRCARRMLERHYGGARTDEIALWTMLSVEVWYREVFLPQRTGSGRMCPNDSVPVITATLPGALGEHP